MKNSINNKLAVGFGLCLLLIVAVVGFNFSALQKLEKLYHETLKRSVDLELATDARNIGEDLYMIIANAVINRDMVKSEQGWAAGKKESLEKLPKIAAAADTPEERASVREAEKAINDIIRIYEQEMLPLIRMGAKVPGPLSDVDARLDRQIETIDLSLKQVARSMSNKNQKAAREFNTVLENIRRFGLLISISGVLTVIIIITISTRKIVRPLMELTDAALEMQKGNYIVELKHQSNDEVGVLTAAFGDMSGQVEKRTVELQLSNEHLQREISERRQVEEEVCRLNAKLEQRVVERTSELVGANEQLQQVIAAQEQAEEEIRSSREELRNLTAYLQSVREEERTRISREIHDELGQALTALKLDLSWLCKRLRKDQALLIEKTGLMTSLIEMIIQTVQRISQELRPGMLDDLGLLEAMDWETKEFQNRTGIACVFAHDPADFNVDRERSTTVFRIFQETLTNVARHAQASEVKVNLEEKGGTLTLVVQDNGMGITEKEISEPRSLGLIGIRERARLCDGEVKICGSSHEGTTVKLIIPLNKKGEPDDKNPHRG